MTAREFRDEMLRIVANEGDSNAGDAIRAALRRYAPPESCCADGHDYQPRHDEHPQFAMLPSNGTIACKRWIGDRCTRCGDWKSRP